jgi:anti-sigma B factor antagonist
MAMTQLDQSDDVQPANVPHVVLTLAGELDTATIADITERISDAIAVASETVVLDLWQVTFIDSLSLGALVHARNLCAAYGLTLCLRAPSRSVQRLLELTGTVVLFNIEPSASE